MAVSRKADLETYVDTFVTRMRVGLVQLKVANDLDGKRISDHDEVLSMEDIGSLMSVMGDPTKPVFLQMADVLDDLLVAKGWANRDAEPTPTPEPTPEPVLNTEDPDPVPEPDPVVEPAPADPVPATEPEVPADPAPADPQP